MRCALFCCSISTGWDEQRSMLPTGSLVRGSKNVQPRPPKADPSSYGEFFKQHIWERAQFYDSLARRALNHNVRHTVVLHHNALNALFLDQLIQMFIEKRWKPVNALHAYADRVYDLQPKTLPAGESLIWALAKESGKFDSELRYPGEDDVYENPKMDELGL